MAVSRSIPASVEGTGLAIECHCRAFPLPHRLSDIPTADELKAIEGRPGCSTACFLLLFLRHQWWRMHWILPAACWQCSHVGLSHHRSTSCHPVAPSEMAPSLIPVGVQCSSRKAVSRDAPQVGHNFEMKCQARGTSAFLNRLPSRLASSGDTLSQIAASSSPSCSVSSCL